MKKTIVVLAGIIIILVLFGVFLKNNAYAPEKLGGEVKIGESKPSSTNEAESFTISTSKVGTHSTVFKKYYSGQTEKILEFTELIAADDSGNYWSGLPASAALSPDSSKLAYIDIEGLKVRDQSNNQDVTLIKKLGEPRGVVKGYRNWEPSIENASSIHEPRWSSDGKFISFLIAQYEGSTLGVIDINKHKIVFGPMSRGRYWSKVGHSLLLISSSQDCEACAERILVLDAETGKELEISKNELNFIEKDFITK